MPKDHEARQLWLNEVRVLLRHRPKVTAVHDDSDLKIDTGTPLERKPLKRRARDDSALGSGIDEQLSKELWRKRDDVRDRGLEEALDRLRNRYTLDRTATIDQLTGRAFSTVRQDQLGELPESGYLAQGYGLKAAIKKPSESGSDPGIRVQDKLSTGYMRDELPSATSSPFRLLYKAEKGKEPGPNVHFLNSTLAYRKMKALAPVGLVLPEASELLPLPKDKPVCWALEFDDAERKLAELMHSSGATPSTHTALKSLARSTGALPPPLDTAVGAKVVPMHDTFGKGAGKKLAELKPGHPAKATATSVQNLLGKLEISDVAAADPLVKNALANLDKLVSGMAACADDATRFSQLYDLFVEEMFLVLARARPYTADDFRAGTVNSLKERAPALKTLAKDVEIKPFLVASGMDALSSALIGAQEHHGGKVGVDRDESDKSYFETAGLLDHAQGVKGKGPVLLAALNGSTPVADGKGLKQAGGVIDLVTRKLEATKPALVTLILDITIEKGGDEGKTDLALIFENPPIKQAIDEGRLSVVLCKSYQKYSTMGSGKIMAGNLTLVGKPEATAGIAKLLHEAEKENNPYDGDEAQLMTHMLTKGAQDETALLQHATANATLLHQQCWPKNSEATPFEEGLPFVMAPQQVKVGGKEVNTMDLCAKMGVDWRESFSFQQSSCLATYSNVRINTGQESDAGCLEKLFVVGLASQGEVQPLALSRDVDHDLTLLGTAVESGRKAADPFAASKAASRLLMTAKVIEPTEPKQRQALQVQMQALLDLDAKEQVLRRQKEIEFAKDPAKLKKWLEERPAQLTPEMRTKMARHCLSLSLAAQKEPLPDLTGQKEAVGSTLRDAFGKSGDEGKWATSGGRKILVAIEAYSKAKTRDNAKALVDECVAWLTGHKPSDPAYSRIEALHKDALSVFQRLNPAGQVKPLLKAMAYAEDVAGFLISDAPKDLFGSEDVETREGGELIDACLSRLDLNSRIALLGKLDLKSALGAAVRRRLQALLDSDEPTKLLAPETLADVDPGQDGPARSISQEDLELARKEFVAAQCKTWGELEGWRQGQVKIYLKHPSLERPWFKALVDLSEGLAGEADKLGKINDAVERDKQMEGARARAAKALTASIARMYMVELEGKVKAAVQNREVQEAKRLRDEKERMEKQELERLIKDGESLSSDALIDQMKLGTHTEGLKLWAAAMVAANDWKTIDDGWNNLFKHVQNAVVSAAEPKDELERLAAQQMRALKSVLEQRLSEAYEKCRLALEPKPQALPDWLINMRKAIEQDGLGNISKGNYSRLIDTQVDVPGLDDRARKLRVEFQKGRDERAKNLAANDDCWPA
jgi:hypothetical protein